MDTQALTTFVDGGFFFLSFDVTRRGFTRNPHFAKLGCDGCFVKEALSPDADEAKGCQNSVRWPVR